MTHIILKLLRTYFQILAYLAPRTAGRHAYWLFSRPRRRASIPPKVEDVMAKAERIDVIAGEEQVAAYRWLPPTAANAEAPRVLLVHGWESRAARLAVWVEPLLNAGFEVVAFDAPAHGESSGRHSSPMAFVDALQAVVERAGPISACVGHSLGGFSCMLAIGGGQLSGHEALSVERLVILAGADSGVDAMSMFCDILDLGEVRLRGQGRQPFLPLLLAGAAEGAGGLQVADFDAHRIFVNHPVPTLWLHDPKDPEVPFEAAQRVAGVCPHVDLQSIDGLGHHRIARAPKMIRRGLDFLEPLVRRSAA